MKWINPKNKMPKPMQRVDVWVDAKTYSFRVADCFTDKFCNDFFKSDHTGHWEKITNVTHWMKLPEPPKS